MKRPVHARADVRRRWCRSCFWRRWPWEVAAHWHLALLELGPRQPAVVRRNGARAHCHGIVQGSRLASMILPFQFLSEQEMENYELENSHQTQNQKKKQGLHWCGRVWFNSTWTLLYQLLSALLVFVMPSWAGVHVSCGCLPSQKHEKCKGTERGETPPSFHTLSLSHAFTSVWWSA